MKRGALIVFEGCDRAGKSTQCKKLVEVLQAQGKMAESMRFPDRTTVLGKMIDSYLKKELELQDNAVHLLFSANRWEMVPFLQKQLKDGKTVVVDRYAYSGAAFTAAKQGFDLQWCKMPDVGLPKPDLVIYLDVDMKELEKRANYGEERYECAEFQKRVKTNFQKLKESNWKILDASQSIDGLHRQILQLTEETVNGDLPDPMYKLQL